MNEASTRRAKQLLAVVIFSIITLFALSVRNSRIEDIASGRSSAKSVDTPYVGQGATQTYQAETVPDPLDSAAVESLTMLSEPIREQRPQTQLPQSTTASRDLTDSLWKAVFYTGLMIGAILIGANLIKKYGGDRLSQTSSSDIEIVGRKYLTPKQSLAIIKVREKELLVGITDHNIQLLDRLDTDED